MSEKIEVICPECGEAMEVSDIRAFLLSIHEANVCTALEDFMGVRDGG